MWFYVLAATPYVIIASGILLAAIITTVILSQTKAPVEAHGFYPRHAAAESTTRFQRARMAPRPVTHNHSARLSGARFSAVS